MLSGNSILRHDLMREESPRLPLTPSWRYLTLYGMLSFDIYTDGACSGSRRVNGVPQGIGGWAAILINGSFRFAISGHEKQTTNNRCELLAVVRGLEAVGKTRAKVRVVLDSSYVKNAFTQGWLKKWERNGWVSSRGDPVANLDLWKELMCVVQLYDVSWKHVRGHQTNVWSNKDYFWNDKADEFAVRAKKTGSGEAVML